MAAHWWILRAVMALEDRIIALILRQPGFHRAVGRVHKTIHERQYGRNPHEPLAPGEATADPNSPNRSQSFFRHFRDELKNQFQGKPTDISNQPPKNKSDFEYDTSDPTQPAVDDPEHTWEAKDDGPSKGYRESTCLESPGPYRQGVQSSAKVNQPASPGPGKSFPVKEAVLVQIRLLQMLPTSPFEKLVSISVMVSSIPSHGSTKEAVVHVNAV